MSIADKRIDKRRTVVEATSRTKPKLPGLEPCILPGGGDILMLDSPSSATASFSRSCLYLSFSFLATRSLSFSFFSRYFFCF